MRVALGRTPVTFDQRLRAPRSARLSLAEPWCLALLSAAALSVAMAGCTPTPLAGAETASAVEEVGADLGSAAVEVEDVWLRTDSLEVAPGSVLLWPSDGSPDRGGELPEVSSCSLDEAPATLLGNGDCLLAVDLVAEGQLLAVRELASGSGGQARRRRERVWLEVGPYGYPEQHIKLSSNRHVDLSEEDGARAARESERIKQLWQLDTPQRFQLPLGAPLANLPAGGRFGSRRWFNGQPRSPHTGADYAANTGTPVLATADGTVALAEEHFFGGRSVFVDHGGGLVSMALHLSEILVEPGQDVRRGDVIGKVGSTGRSTGPHLHFGLRLRGARVDPAQLMRPPAQWPEWPEWPEAMP